MTTTMTPELYWTILTALVTSVFWLPHILQRIIEFKPYEALRDPRHDVDTKADWAQRAIRAHTNAIENLLVFGLLALAIRVLDVGTPATAFAAAAFFFSRAAHYIIYILALPWLRTPAFLIGFGSQLILGATLLGIV